MKSICLYNAHVHITLSSQQRNEIRQYTTVRIAIDPQSLISLWNSRMTIGKKAYGDFLKKNWNLILV